MEDSRYTAEQISASPLTLFGSLAKAACVLTGIIAVVVLVGWLYNIEGLKSFFSNAVAMKPNAAVSFLLLAVSLWLTLTPRTARGKLSNLVVKTCPALVAAVGALTLSEDFFGWDLGIDQLLFREQPGAIETAISGRMAPNTAFNLILLGCSLLLSDSPKAKGCRFSQLLAITAAMIGFLAVLGRAYGAESLYGFLNFTLMAIHTALAFIIISLGILFACRQEGLMAVLSSPGGGGIMARRLLPAAVVIPFLLGWMSRLGEQKQFYDAAFSDSLVVFGSVILFCLLIFATSRALERVDSSLVLALKELRQSRDELEARVQERTAELTIANRNLNAEIAERKAMQEKLLMLTLTDDLTGLYNRRGFFVLAEQQLKLTNRMKKRLFILYADLDDLKTINDAFGHQEGDLALSETSDILRKTFRESDIMARIGGDEFVVMPIGVEEIQIENVIERLQKIIKFQNANNVRKYKLSLSVGIAYFDPENPCSIDELLAQGDSMMYEKKKRRGKS